MRTGLIAIVVTLLCATAVQAQQVPANNVLGPSDSLQLTWKAEAPSPDGLDAPTGYRVKALSLAGESMRTWDTGANVQTLTLTPQMVPPGAFRITVHAFNLAGEAEASDVIGPFGKAATPKRLTTVSGSVVAGER